MIYELQIAYYNLPRKLMANVMRYEKGDHSFAGDVIFHSSPFEAKKTDGPCDLVAMATNQKPDKLKLLINDIGTPDYPRL